MLFLFSGGGAHPRMGRVLAARYPVFAAALAAAADAIAAAGGRRVWYPHSGFEVGEAGVDNTQPAVFAFELALAELLAAWGVRPDAVAGHGVGEIAAAVTGGALSLADAARIVVARGRILTLVGNHAAAAVLEATPAEAMRLVEPMREVIGVAAVDGPSSITVSGEPRYIDALVRRAHRRAIFAQRISPDGPAAAVHIPRMRNIAPQLIMDLAGIEALTPALPIYSTTRRGALIGEQDTAPTHDVRASGLAGHGPGANSGLAGYEPGTDNGLARTATTGAAAEGAIGVRSALRMDANYWGEHAAGPVELAAALERAAAEGISTVLEIAPHPILAPVLREHPVFREASYPVASRTDECGDFLRAIARLYLDGRPIDWTALGPHTAAPPQRHWRSRTIPDPPGPRFPSVTIRPEGTYVVAGGLGELGAAAVGWLLDSGARDVVVLARVPRALPPPLEGLEDRIVVVRCDTGDRNDLAIALQDIREFGVPIRGVVHAIREPQPVAASNLVELTDGDPTDFTVVCAPAGAALVRALTDAHPRRRIMTAG
ncbi:acyltransferase domain-containing protein [Nocardia sp. IFM 10818]